MLTFIADPYGEPDCQWPRRRFIARRISSFYLEIPGELVVPDPIRLRGIATLFWQAAWTYFANDDSVDMTDIGGDDVV